MNYVRGHRGAGHKISVSGFVHTYVWALALVLLLSVLNWM
jgi:hypothetical protein